MSEKAKPRLLKIALLKEIDTVEVQSPTVSFSLKDYIENVLAEDFACKGDMEAEYRGHTVVAMEIKQGEHVGLVTSYTFRR